MTKKIVVGLDIGTTKICSIVGRLNEHNKLEVLGVGKRPSDGGVTRGVVTNINKTVDAIIHSVKQAEEISNVDIQNVHVGIAGSHIKSFQHSGMLIRQDVESEITQTDLNRLEEDMHRTAVQPGDKILHVLPQDYTVDGEPNILDPIGMAGIRLEGNFHIITGQISAVKNINRCVQRSDFQVAGVTLEPLASASAVLSPEELEAGVALVDIGGGTTDVAIFHESIIRHSAVIPYGGDIITKDIKEGCSVMQSHAELLKVKAGSCLAELTNENEIITIPGIRGRDPKEISVEKIFSNSNPDSTMKLGKARGIVFLVAARKGLKISEYSPNTIKKSLVGYGHADKNQIKKMIERIYPNIEIENEDSADIVTFLAGHFAPLAQLWTSVTESLCFLLPTLPALYALRAIVDNT